MQNIFYIDLNIYPKEKILEAISDFSEVNLIELKDDKLTIHWENQEDIDETFLEFWNYVIWLINE